MWGSIRNDGKLVVTVRFAPSLSIGEVSVLTRTPRFNFNHRFWARESLKARPFYTYKYIYSILQIALAFLEHFAQKMTLLKLLPSPIIRWNFTVPVTILVVTAILLEITLLITRGAYATFNQKPRNSWNQMCLQIC